MSINELFAKYNFNINGKIEKVEVNVKDRALRITLKPMGEIADSEIFHMQKLLMQAYGLENVVIEKTDEPEPQEHPAEEKKEEPAKEEISDYEKIRLVAMHRNGIGRSLKLSESE